MSALLAVCASGAAHCISTACGGEIVADEAEDLVQLPFLKKGEPNKKTVLDLKNNRHLLYYLMSR